jgi:hypothetical protein
MYLYVYQNSLEYRISYSRGKKDGGSLRQEETESKRDTLAVSWEWYIQDCRLFFFLLQCLMGDNGVELVGQLLIEWAFWLVVQGKTLKVPLLSILPCVLSNIHNDRWITIQQSRSLTNNVTNRRPSPCFLFTFWSELTTRDKLKSFFSLTTI